MDFYALSQKWYSTWITRFCGLVTLSEHLVFAVTERTEAEISRPDAIMALLREPPIFHVELLVEDEGVTPNDEQR